ncbi:MAG TPA: hypothetical protein VNI54_10545 [Thermoanaerobaculia bacterium]|nr:hypothetical protein [Thermoanaerobaculia bacterium]
MRRNNVLLFVSAVLFVVIVVVAPSWLSGPKSMTVTIAAVLAFILTAGKLISGNAMSVFITPMNTMSLSRMQTVLWTVLITASFISVAFERLYSKATAANALDFTVPETLLGLIGISLTSAVASSVVNSGKAAKQASVAQVQQAAQKTNESVQATGTLFGYDHHSKASFMDIFEGDELGDAHAIDLGKIQMFFFTVVGAAVYLGEMYSQLATGPTSLPALPENLVILMGMSHAGYVGNKMVNRTPEVPATQVEAAPMAGAGTYIPAEQVGQPKLTVGAPK